MFILRGLIFTPVILKGLSLLQVGEGSFIMQGGEGEGRGVPEKLVLKIQ